MSKKTTKVRATRGKATKVRSAKKKTPVVRLFSFANRNLMILTEGFRCGIADLKPVLTVEQRIHRDRVDLARRLGVKGVSERWTSNTLRRYSIQRREAMISELRRLRYRGCNSASRWSDEVLYERLMIPIDWH